MESSFLEEFYKLLLAREKFNSWRPGGKTGAESAAKQLLGKFRSNSDPNGRVPAKQSKRHGEYLQAKAKVKSSFQTAQTKLEGLMPANLSYRARLRVVSFLDRILANERFTVPSLKAILRSSSCH